MWTVTSIPSPKAVWRNCWTWRASPRPAPSSARCASAAGWRAACRLLALLLLTAWGPAAWAADTVVPAEALALGDAKTAILIDVRTPVEWRDTGIPTGAAAISWGRADFAERVLAQVKGDRAAAIVLICRTGNRSGKAVAHLRDQGFTNVRHVPEGMVGSAAGPGWIARGLPVADWSGD